MEPCGHQLLFTFTEFYLRFLFALHGQMVTCSFTVFEQIKAKNYAFQPITSIKTISWQCAILFRRPNIQPVMLLIIDHNRINSCYLLLRSRHSSAQDPQRNCDPRLNWQAYETRIRQSFVQLGQQSGKSIFEVILQNKACFNGFGLNLATEALHHARIHPMWSSQLVFQKSNLREQLLEGLRAVAMKDITLWNKHIPGHVHLDDPFCYNQRAIEFYQQHMNCVYNKKDCLVPTDICAALFKNGLLVFPSLFIFINYRFLNHLESVLRKKLCVGVFQSTKSGENINVPVFLVAAHQVHIPIL